MDKEKGDRSLALIAADCRGKLDINQTEMGARLGISLTGYCNLELGYTLRPKLKTMRLLAELSGMDLDSLMMIRYKGSRNK